MRGFKIYTAIAVLFLTVPVFSQTNVQIYGTAGLYANTKKGTAKITIDTIQNFSAGKTSGDLRVCIYFSDTEFDGKTLNGQVFAAFNLNPLSPGGMYVNLKNEIPFAELPEGLYYKTICLEEEINNKHHIIDYIKFEDQDELNYPKLEFNSLIQAKNSKVKRNVYALNMECPEKPGDFEEFKNLAVLSIACRSNSLPEWVMDMNNLQGLKLKMPKLEMLPENLGNLSRLKELDISMSPVNNLPASIGNLYDLRVLILSNTLISELPSELSRLRGLEKLHLENLEITSLAPVAELYELRTLNIAGTGFTELPEEILHLKKLRHLNLSNTKIEKLPKDLSELNKLEVLNLSYTPVTSIPKNLLKNLPELKEINISNSKITDKEAKKIESQLPENCMIIR